MKRTLLVALFSMLAVGTALAQGKKNKQPGNDHYVLADFREIKWGTHIDSVYRDGAKLNFVKAPEVADKNAYVLVIGKLFSPADVGFYQRAKSLQQLPVANIQSILGRVLFPLFSEIQREPERLRRVHLERDGRDRGAHGGDVHDHDDEPCGKHEHGDADQGGRPRGER